MDTYRRQLSANDSRSVLETGNTFSAADYHRVAHPENFTKTKGGDQIETIDIHTVTISHHRCQLLTYTMHMTDIL